MGIDFYLMTQLLAEHGAKIAQLYDTDRKQFKKLFNDTKASIGAGLKLNNGKPTPEIMNRKLVLDMFATINAKKKADEYIKSSKDEIATFLRGEAAAENSNEKEEEKA